MRPPVSALYSDLSDAAFRLYAVMLDVAGTNGSLWLTVAYLSGLLGRSDPRETQRLLNRLERAGWVKPWTCGGDCGTHEGRPYPRRHYTLLTPPCASDSSQIAEPCASDSSPGEGDGFDTRAGDGFDTQKEYQEKGVPVVKEPPSSSEEKAPSSSSVGQRVAVANGGAVVTATANGEEEKIIFPTERRDEGMPRTDEVYADRVAAGGLARAEVPDFTDWFNADAAANGTKPIRSSLRAVLCSDRFDPERFVRDVARFRSWHAKAQRKALEWELAHLSHEMQMRWATKGGSGLLDVYVDLRRSGATATTFREATQSLPLRGWHDPERPDAVEWLREVAASEQVPDAEPVVLELPTGADVKAAKRRYREVRNPV